MATPPPQFPFPDYYYSSAPTGSSAIADLERKVKSVVMESEAHGNPPWLCAVEVGRCCASDENGDLGFPDADLASVLVSNLCFSHNTPFMWKLLDQTMASGLIHPLHVLALLTSMFEKYLRLLFYYLR